MSDTLFYDDVVMDHIRNARNYRVMEDADAVTSGSNPLCGDELVLYTRAPGERLEDVAFQCTCCGISMASASIMSELTKGRPASEIEARAQALIAAIGSARDAAHDAACSSEGERALLDTVRRFPARSRCAALPWETLLSALGARRASRS